MSATSRKKWGVTAAVLVAVVAGGLGVRALRGGGDGGPTYQTAEVTRGRIAAQVTATGTLSPVVEVQVGSQVSGRILELHADFNSEVTKGQVIARIDPQLFQTEVGRAKANLVSAQAAVTRAEAELRDAKQKADRAVALAAESLVAQADVDSAQTALASAQAGVASARAVLSQARAGLQTAETNLAYTTIVSPIDGVVISRDVDVGQTVAASLQAPTLFTIAEDLAKMEVHTSVAESDVGSLSNGMAVEFTVDAFPQDRFKGAVKQVRYSPTTVSNVVTYDAVVAVDNPELKLRPGMTANATFVTQEREGALAVPSAALRFRPSPEVLAELGLDEASLRSRPSAAAPSGGAAAPAVKVADGGTPAATSAPASGSAAPPRRRRGRAADGDAAAGRPANLKIVWKLSAGKPEPIRVRTGISDGRVTEIVEVLSGQLAPGDELITGIEGQAPAGAPAGGQQGGARRGPPRFL